MNSQFGPSPKQTVDNLATLLQRIERGEEEALAELYSQTEALLLALIRRIIKDYWRAQEVLQDVYVHIWRNAADYQCDRGAPVAWMYMLARSRALDSLRRNRRLSAMYELDDQVLAALPGARAVEPPEIWWHVLVRRGVRELPAAQERLIGLAFFEGYTHSEIAESTGLPLGTVKTRIRMALNKLRDAIPSGYLETSGAAAIPGASAAAKRQTKTLRLAA